MQITPRLPIAAVLIGTCPITRNFVAQKPNREARGRSHPLPPALALRLGGRLLIPLEAASIIAVARSAAGPLLPNPNLFSHGCVRKEALLSLRIKGGPPPTP